MKNFEMPKMNVSVFSSEDIVTTSTQTTVTKTELAERALTATVGAGNITTVSAADWINQ